MGVLRGSSIFWVKINNLDLLLFGFSTFSNHKKKKKKKNLGCNEIKKKNLKKKEDRRNKYIMMKKEKKNEYVSFVDWRSFKTNKRVIIFCRELVSRSRNLNQHKSRSLLKTKRHFNVEVGIYYFCQFTILTPFLSFR